MHRRPISRFSARAAATRPPAGPLLFSCLAPARPCDAARAMAAVLVVWVLPEFVRAHDRPTNSSNARTRRARPRPRARASSKRSSARRRSGWNRCAWRISNEAVSACASPRTHVPKAFRGHRDACWWTPTAIGSWLQLLLIAAHKENKGRNVGGGNGYMWLVKQLLAARSWPSSSTTTTTSCRRRTSSGSSC